MIAGTRLAELLCQPMCRVSTLCIDACFPGRSVTASIQTYLIRADQPAVAKGQLEICQRAWAGMVHPWWPTHAGEEDQTWTPPMAPMKVVFERAAAGR